MSINARLSKTLQRYENKSKSQRFGNMLNEAVSCLRLCKDTKIKANHNFRWLAMLLVLVV